MFILIFICSFFIAETIDFVFPLREHEPFSNRKKADTLPPVTMFYSSNDEDQSAQNSQNLLKKPLLVRKRSSRQPITRFHKSNASSEEDSDLYSEDENLKLHRQNFPSVTAREHKNGIASRSFLDEEKFEGSPSYPHPRETKRGWHNSSKTPQNLQQMRKPARNFNKDDFSSSSESESSTTDKTDNENNKKHKQLIGQEKARTLNAEPDAAPTTKFTVNNNVGKFENRKSWQIPSSTGRRRFRDDKAFDNGFYDRHSAGKKGKKRSHNCSACGQPVREDDIDNHHKRHSQAHRHHYQEGQVSDNNWDYESQSDDETYNGHSMPSVVHPHQIGYVLQPVILPPSAGNTVPMLNSAVPYSNAINPYQQYAGIPQMVPLASPGLLDLQQNQIALQQQQSSQQPQQGTSGSGISAVLNQKTLGSVAGMGLNFVPGVGTGVAVAGTALNALGMGDHIEKLPGGAFMNSVLGVQSSAEAQKLQPQQVVNYPAQMYPSAAGNPLHGMATSAIANAAGNLHPAAVAALQSGVGQQVLNAGVNAAFNAAASGNLPGASLLSNGGSGTVGGAAGVAPGSGQP